MVVGVRQRAAIDRLEAEWRAHFGPPTLVPGGERIRQYPELECLRPLLSEETIANAGRRADSVGTGADRVLVGAGILDEELYLRALADALALKFETFDPIARAACPLGDQRLIDAPKTGLLPLMTATGLVFVVAPRGTCARRICEFISRNPHRAARFRLTTAERLQRYVVENAGAALADRATNELAQEWPEFSAGPASRQVLRGGAAVAALAGIAALLAAPGVFVAALEVLLSVVFLGWVVLRLSGLLIERPRQPRLKRLADGELPVYSVMVALYREAAAVDDLIAALRRLDYPPEKLDIKLIVEPDDVETREALERLRLGAPFEIVVAPEGGPRTKPKALNAALPFARGSFIVIYDAEDRPEPGQLRHALAAFRAHGKRLACVQASLTIDNSADNWMTALFTAEYAGQFDVFLPALTALRMPLPLGGSSNHFRTATLRAIGAWDPYNVTEDADLGLRLARFGYRSVAIAPATYEEAPGEIGAWLRQRTRWFKGWMQTWLVHMRQPARLARELGLGGFLTVQLMIGGSVLASLVHPLMLAWLLSALIGQGPIWDDALAAGLFGTTAISGYLASALLGAIGLLRRRLLGHAWALLLMPLHWLLLSVAAWRALYQLVRDPYRWEKTEHGLARTSRSAARAQFRLSRQVPTIIGSRR